MGTQIIHVDVLFTNYKEMYEHCIIFTLHVEDDAIKEILTDEISRLHFCMVSKAETLKSLRTQKKEKEIELHAFVQKHLLALKVLIHSPLLDDQEELWHKIFQKI